MKAGLLFLCGFVVLAAACGGSVVFEEDGGDGGSGGSGANGSTGTSASKGTTTGVGQATTSVGSTNATVGTTDVGTSSVSVGTSTGGGCSIGEPPPNNCQQACSDIFDCGTLFCDGQQLCPGFFPGSKMQFMMGCIPTCQDNMALVTLIDPSSCDVTIQTLVTLNQQFAQTCSGNFGPQ